MFERMRQIAEASTVPVNGDLEDGYGERPEDVATTIRMASDAGLAGGNIEDYDGRALYDEELSVERIVAAREAAGSDFVLTARTDGQLLKEPTSLADTITASQPVPRSRRRLPLRARRQRPRHEHHAGEGDRRPAQRRPRPRRHQPHHPRPLRGRRDPDQPGRQHRPRRAGLHPPSAHELATEGTISFAENQIPQAELNTLFAKYA